MHIEAGQLLYSIEFGEQPEKILCGNKKSEIDMKDIFKSYEFNREEQMSQNFMRTVISALSCTKANLGSNFEIVEQKQKHITKLLQKGDLGIDALKLNSQGQPQLDFVKNRRSLNRVLLSQLLQKQIGLENSDLITIQDSCSYLRKIKARVHNLETTKFSIFEKILYKFHRANYF